MPNLDHTISKSDFIAGLSCIQKVVFRKAGYPKKSDDDAFIQMLVEGGYLIGQIARLHFPEGQEVAETLQDALPATATLLQKEDVILFEPAFSDGQLTARADILVKRGRMVQVIEVKSRIFDSSHAFKEKAFDEILLDLAFQALLITSIHPEWDVSFHLMMPDKSKASMIPELPSWFENNWGASEGVDSEPFVFPELLGKDEKEVVQRAEMIREHSFLTMIDVSAYVLPRIPEVRRQAQLMLNALNDGSGNRVGKPGWVCKSCEFRVENGRQSGFDLCWSEMPKPKYHLFELYKGNSLKGPNGESWVEAMLQSGESSLLSIDPNALGLSTNKPVSKRQRIQIECTRNGTEWLSEELPEVLSQFKYPWHFIDFETYVGGVPFHAGMRPGDMLAFQWSCHTILGPSVPPVHAGWLHTTSDLPNGAEIPNFRFADSLMKHVGHEGTFFCWGTHEMTVLSKVLEMMETFEVNDPELLDWLGFASGKQGFQPWKDMNALTLKHYFHPDMKGSTSIKKVLPAVWNAHPWLHQIDHFKEFAPLAGEVGNYDPYARLRSLNGGGEAEVVDGGTDAMRAYCSLRFGRGLSERQRGELQRQLWDYCRLDTLAMLIVHTRWMHGA